MLTVLLQVLAQSNIQVINWPNASATEAYVSKGDNIATLTPVIGNQFWSSEGRKLSYAVGDSEVGDGINGVVGVSKNRNRYQLDGKFQLTDINSYFPKKYDEFIAQTPVSTFYRIKNTLYENSKSGSIHQILKDNLISSDSAIQIFADKRSSARCITASNQSDGAVFWRNHNKFLKIKQNLRTSFAVCSANESIIYGGSASREQGQFNVLSESYFSRYIPERYLFWRPGRFIDGVFIEYGWKLFKDKNVVGALLLGKLGKNNLFLAFHDGLEIELYVEIAGKLKTLSEICGIPNVKFSGVMDLELGINRILLSGEGGGKKGLFLIIAKD